MGGVDSHVVVVGKIFPREKRSVRQCSVVMQQPAILLAKFGPKSLLIFTQLA
jgi:hypothetical protein